MSSLILFPTTLLGIVLVVTYWIRCHIRHAPLDAVDVVNLLLLSAGIVAGIVLCASGLCESLRKQVEEDIWIYVVIAGLVVFIISVQAVCRMLGLPWGNKTAGAAGGAEELGVAPNPHAKPRPNDTDTG